MSLGKRIKREKKEKGEIRKNERKKKGDQQLATANFPPNATRGSDAK